MDKIDLTYWDRIFGKTDQQVIFASERYTDVRFSFEESGLASGYVQSLSTPGMRLTEISVKGPKPFQLVDNDVSEAAESVFMLDGAAESRFHNLSSPLQLQKNQHNFQYNRQFCGEHLIGPAGFHALTITYDLPFLRQLVETDDSASLAHLANSVHGQKTFIAAPQTLAFQGRLSEVVGSMRQCPFTGVTRYLFLESKMMELFVLQMEQAYAATERKEENGWSASDRERLHAVKNYIETAYLETFSLKDLTYRFGLNEFKLKKGYKQLFQTTVFGHVHQLRMQKAKELLEQRIMNVSEASFYIGYNNVSSFCTEFKKRFGYSPGRWGIVYSS